MFNDEKDFARRVTAPPRCCVGYDPYEDYADGYAAGLKADVPAAERHRLFLAMSAGWMVSNTPNNVLYGYIHGQHERQTGQVCPAALAYAHKLGRSEHFRQPLVKFEKGGRALRREKRERWVKLGTFLEAAGIVADYKPQPLQSLGDVVGAALREVLAK